MTEPRGGGLSLWRLAWRLLCRDLASGRLTVMLAATVIAVASTVAVSLLVTRVDRALVAESSTLLAGDLAVLSSAPPPANYISDATALGLSSARLAAMRSVVGRGEQLQLVQLKAVDDAYPLRGQLLIAEAETGPPLSVAHGPPHGEVWAESKLLGQLHLSIGDTLTIGSAHLRLTRILVLEPDRGSDLFSIAPRVLMHYADLAATGLIVPGSRVSYTTLLAGRVSPHGMSRRKSSSVCTACSTQRLASSATAMIPFNRKISAPCSRVIVSSHAASFVLSNALANTNDSDTSEGS